MILEKPNWLHHAGLQIFSLDIQPDGTRFATAGVDHKVRIWNMASLKESTDNSLHSKLLATLRDHFGSVNCVRWAKNSQLIASGSDDHLIHIHTRQLGSGTTEFGSGEPPDVENWKILLTLRGHASDVVDIEWSPDDSMLASCSLDNTVRIWQANTGLPIAVLNGHKSLVKGVAWDPVGSFLASQADDKTVIIWHTSTWTIVHKAEGPWEKTVGSTFFRRLDWSPCGHFITTTHGFQNPSHTAPVLERGDWCTTFDFVGHTAPVVAVRYNRSMFRKLPSAFTTIKVIQTIDSNNKDPITKPSLSDPPPYNVIAMGSQDCCITVWTTASPRPVFVGKHFFTQSVVDLSWSPDGYTLFCCSLDGSVAAFSFEPRELGQKITDAEMEEFKKIRYGHVKVGHRSVAESAAQLTLEAAAANQTGNSTVTNLPILQPGPQQPSEVPMPTASMSGGVANRVKSVMLQTEYIRSDGRRRIIPQALEHTGIENRVAITAGSEKSDSFTARPGSLGGRPAKISKGGDIGDKMRGLPSTRTFAKGQSDTDGRFSGGVSAEGSFPKSIAMSSITNQFHQPTDKHNIPVLCEINTINVVLSYRLPQDVGKSASEAPIALEARPAGTPGKGASTCNGTLAGRLPTKYDIVCSQGGKILWSDQLLWRPSILTGNTKFWAVASLDGSLQIYTYSGRRFLPLIMVGGAVAFLDCDKGWRLLLLTMSGCIHFWDLQQSCSILHESIAALIHSQSEGNVTEASSVKAVSARLSEAGAPLIMLTNHHVLMFHISLKCWVRVTDIMAASSTFYSADVYRPLTSDWRKPNGGTSLVKDTSFWNRAYMNDAEGQTRANLEVKLTAAKALQSSDEYRQCLLAYTRHLAKDADILRLRELCEELLGPLHAAEGIYTPVSADQTLWDPHILGMKKRDLLKNDVLPAMASNRAIQRLLNEFVDLLAEYESM